MMCKWQFLPKLQIMPSRNWQKVKLYARDDELCQKLCNYMYLDWSVTAFFTDEDTLGAYKSPEM